MEQDKKLKSFIKTTIREFLNEQKKEKDIRFLWKNDKFGFIPKEIIDKEEEPVFFINAKYNKNGYFLIITYGENISKHYNKGPYEVLMYLVDKKIVKKYILDTNDVDTNDILTYSNLTDVDKMDNINIAFALLEVFNDPIKKSGFNTKYEARNMAHKLWAENI
jgi:hypothetical protein